jgi:hypothetical protein
MHIIKKKKTKQQSVVNMVIVENEHHICLKH